MLWEQRDWRRGDEKSANKNHTPEKKGRVMTHYISMSQYEAELHAYELRHKLSMPREPDQKA